MCIGEFDAFHSLELEISEYGLKEGRDDVPIAGQGSLELSSFMEIQMSPLVAAKVENTSIFESYKLSDFSLKFVSYIE